MLKTWSWQGAQASADMVLAGFFENILSPATERVTFLLIHTCLTLVYVVLHFTSWEELLGPKCYEFNYEQHRLPQQYKDTTWETSPFHPFFSNHHTSRFSTISDFKPGKFIHSYEPVVKQFISGHTKQNLSYFLCPFSLRELTQA